MKVSSSVLLACWLLPVLVPSAGCTHKPAASEPPPTPTVTVSKPIEREVTDYVDFTGRTDAVYFTEIRPRVTGYLVGMPFKEGAIVKKDDVLFEVDDRPYKAALDLAKASGRRRQGQSRQSASGIRYRSRGSEKFSRRH